MVCKQTMLQHRYQEKRCVLLRIGTPCFGKAKQMQSLNSEYLTEHNFVASNREMLLKGEVIIYNSD